MTDTPRKQRKLLGGAVRRIREAKGLTQDQLATKAGVHFAYLSNVERGKKDPSVDVMIRLADALEVNLEDVTYWTVIYVVADDPAAVA